MTSEQRYDRDFAELWGDVPRPMQESIEFARWMYRKQPPLDFSGAIIYGVSVFQMIGPGLLEVKEIN